jgi:hypothetical protein
MDVDVDADADADADVDVDADADNGAASDISFLSSKYEKIYLLFVK